MIYDGGIFVFRMKREMDEAEHMDKKTKQAKTELHNEIKIDLQREVKILRAHAWHEEGVFPAYFDYLLPNELPSDLDPSLNFLRSIVPTVNSKALTAYNHNDDIVFDDNKENKQFAFHYQPCAQLFDDDKIVFFPLIEKLCGKAVVGVVGTYYTVFVPTFE